MTEATTRLPASPAAESELIQVAIVDDHPVARRGLQSILTEAGDIQVSTAMATPAELERPQARLFNRRPTRPLS